MSDVKYIAGSVPDKLYINPYIVNNTHKGAYAQLVDKNEVLIEEIEVTERSRLAVSAFYANDKKDYTTFKLTKLKFHKTRNWEKDGEIQINGFQLSKLQQFISIISSLNLSDAKKTRVSLDNLNPDALSAILNTDRGAEFLKKIAESPELTEDIFALSHKKAALEEFRKLLNEFATFKDIYISKYNLTAKGEENIWQHFFEQNSWIFGHGLNYVFLDKVGDKLESTTTGSSIDTNGKRTDALMKTRAAISQCVLIEIKTPSSNLLQNKPHHSGCWSISSELADGVSQIQKTAFDFTYNEFNKIQIKDKDGRVTGEEIYRIQPKSYLVIGNLSELSGNDDKFACFHLYRTSLNTPEILTYDELYERAKCIVQTISKQEIES